ncbi:PAS domain S-box-containing protein [Pedobacter sp. ok626]|uniref:PAS domain-containing sensor histidine kinase n=1 Tax=Pedobacter sp. ok626 TaxID=1761882 RepID=UPI00088D7660|nr:PAS domain-containing sensor histidine kinase [Pedobacter sp. ok626]SDJ04767.1 PAS domain S-box-containing protein [Pedobacter sp. ok626]
MPVHSKSSFDYLAHLKDAGEMGNLIYSTNWPNTSLGTADTWPQNLLTALDIMLGSKFPMFLWWGPEHIQFYNDKYKPTLEKLHKHPGALGARAQDCWPEVWQAIEPSIEMAMSGDKILEQEDQLIPKQHNGNPVNSFWVFNCSQLYDVKGKVCGLFVTFYESNSQKKSEHQIYDTLRQLAEREARFRSLLADAPVAIAVFKGRELIIETVNEKMLEVWGKPSTIINKPLKLAIPEIEAQGFLRIMDQVYLTGIPYYGNEVKVFHKHDDKTEEVYSNFVYQPLKNTKGKTDRIMLVANLITEQVKSRMRAEKSEKRFRSLIDALPQMAMTNTAKGKMTFFNQRWYDYTGLSPTETYGRKWLKVIHPDDLHETLRKYNLIRSGQEGGEFENRYRNADGTYRWHLNRMQPIQEDGMVGLWIITATDIHDLKQLQQQKDDFVSIAGHELKTPITSLSAFMQLISRLQKHPETDFLPSLIEKASRSLDKINILVDDLLIASKLNQGELYIKKNWFILSELAVDCCNHLKIEGIYTVKTTGDLNLSVYADPHRIDQVIINFVNNARNYAPESKEIIIDIQKIKNKVKVCVIDKGPGIPQDQIPHLFNRYFRGDKSRSPYSGLGLGLYISSEIIKKHNGEIGAESELGKGSTFWFTLPIE